MPEITLDYMVPLSIQVDTDTGKVVHVLLAGEEFQSGTEKNPQPEQVFTCNNEWEGEELPEYIERDHPAAKLAIEIGESIRLAASEMLLPFVYTDEAGRAVGPATLGAPLEDSSTADRLVAVAEIALEQHNHASIAYDAKRKEERRAAKLAATQIEPGTPSRPSALAAGSC